MTFISGDEAETDMDDADKQSENWFSIINVGSIRWGRIQRKYQNANFVLSFFFVQLMLKNIVMGEIHVEEKYLNSGKIKLNSLNSMNLIHLNSSLHNCSRKRRKLIL